MVVTKSEQNSSISVDNGEQNNSVAQARAIANALKNGISVTPNKPQELQNGGNVKGYSDFGVKATDDAPEFCKGGKTKTMQTGGQVSDEQFPAWLAEVFGVQSEQELQQVAQQLGDNGIKQLYQMYKQGATPDQVRQAMGQAQSHKHGGIIEYYKRLNNL